MALPQVPPPQSVGLLPAEDNGGWFTGSGSWFPEFTWWGSGWDGKPLPPPNTMTDPSPIPVSEGDTGMATAQATPLPPPDMSGPGAGLSSPMIPSGQPDTSTDPWAVVNEYTPPQKYSFLDSPGASDALVAFGAAMLKAPDFNSGLGDAALAVNRVAQSYRMPTEADYARAKQLGMIKRIASGKGAPDASGISVNRDILYRDAEGNTWFDAIGPNGEAGLYNQDTGEFTTGGVPGLTRDVYDYNSNRSRRSAGKDADIEAEFVEKIPGIARTATQFNELYNLAADDTTGIDSSFTVRVARQLTELSPELGAKLTGLDPNNITEFNNRIQQVALDYASNSFKGQGQVTENERLMIKQAVGQPGTLTKQSAMVIFRIMRDAEVRKLKMYQEWSRNPELRDSYNGSFGRYQAEVITNATLEQMQGPSNPAPPQQNAPASGTTGSGIKWKIEQ